MKQSNTESLEILETVLSMMKKIIKNKWEKVILGETNIFNIGRIKILSIEGYLNKIRPYLKNTLNNLKKSSFSKIHSLIAINFISYKDNDEKRVMHSKNDKIELMIIEK